MQPGDNLFEIETDKVSMEVPAIEAGILSEIRVPEGEVAPVGAIVGVIGNGEERRRREHAGDASGAGISRVESARCTSRI